MVVRLGNCGSMPGEPFLAFPVCLQDCLVNLRLVGFKPGEKCRPEIEADLFVVVEK
jgi:hypothetical protein